MLLILVGHVINSPNGLAAFEGGRRLHPLCAPLVLKALASAHVESIDHPLFLNIGHPHIIKIAGDYLFERLPCTHLT